MFKIRTYEEKDLAAVWAIIESVFRAGTSYAFSPKITETEAKKVWLEVPKATYVCENEAGNILATYYIKPNQPTLGAHVCNCGYIVSEHVRGQGIASSMCQHSQQEALGLGFKAMQYNLVVASNEGAIRLWKKLGFSVIGVLPKAFQHPQLGFVDAMIMYKQLEK